MSPPPATSLRRLLSTGAMLSAPGVHDPLTARLAEKAGFEAVYLGGNALGACLAKGQPLLTLTETVEQSARITRTTSLPLIVDAGAGFGARAHVHRAVWEIESSGAAALHIDDQPYPKSPDYHRGRGALASLEEAAGRIHVACRARRGEDFMVFARTDAFRVTGSLDEVARRCRAYAEAGADGLVLLDIDQPEQIAFIRKTVPALPLAWIGGVVPPVPGADALRRAGFAVALYPFNGIAEVADRVLTLWTALRRTGHVPQPPEFLLRMRREISELSGLQTYWQLEDHES